MPPVFVLSYKTHLELSWAWIFERIAQRLEKEWGRLYKTVQAKLPHFTKLPWHPPCRPQILAWPRLGPSQWLKFTTQVGICIILTEPTLEIYMEIFSFTHLERSQGVLLFFLNKLRLPGPRTVGLRSKKIDWSHPILFLSFCSPNCAPRNSSHIQHGWERHSQKREEMSQHHLFPEVLISTQEYPCCFHCAVSL